VQSLKKNESFLLPPSLDFTTVLKEIDQNFSIDRISSTKKQQIFYDTFDWRLFNSDQYLVKEKNEYLLFDRNTENILDSFQWRVKRPIKFWWDCSESSFQNRMKSTLEERALIDLGKFEIDKQAFRILNQDEKTTLRFYYNEIQFAKNTESDPFRFITLDSIRGYTKDFHNFRIFLLNLGLSKISKLIYEFILEKFGKTPGDYSSKLKIILQPSQIGRDAVVTILSNLLDTIKRNEEGIKSDIDTEFLHDFRVATRRTRSILNQIKGIFPKSSLDPFKKDFSKFGKMSNQMRDLDVYLLKEDQYRSMLPEHLHPGLDPLYESLAKQRQIELKELIKNLNSNFYNKLISDWEEYLQNSSNLEQTTNSNTQVFTLARIFIFKQYKKVVSNGEKIDESTPDSELHQLRIECKKLRYLLEFFLSLFPQEEMAKLIKQFKRLQDNLGDFNDLSVQQENLINFMENNRFDGKDGRLVSAAIWGLISVLNQKQKEVRSAFVKTFQEFNSKQTIGIFNKLFGKK